MSLSRRGVLGSVLLLAVASASSAAQSLDKLKTIEVKDPGGQVLSYRLSSGGTTVLMKGTQLAPKARIKVKVTSKPGYVSLELNKSNIQDLQQAYKLGKDYLTYVLWAVSVDGRASNLGEITFKPDSKSDKVNSLNVTTTYQTFWLMVTAEPSYAVVEPSPAVVLYSLNQQAVNESASKKAVPVRGQLFYYTHYTGYDGKSGTPEEKVPNELQQARKAIDLAKSSGILAPGEHPPVNAKEEAFTREALNQAQSFLERAERTYKSNPKDKEIAQFARTAAQSAENARALSVGATGGVVLHQLERKVAVLEKGGKEPEPEPEPVVQPATPEPEPEPAAIAAAKARKVKAEDEPVKTVAPPLIKQPTLWFALGGWGLALILLFRKRSI